MQIPLIKPYINDRVREKVLEVLESGYLTEGPVTKSFEESFREYIGCKHAIAVSSCTTGLEMALRALDIGPGDEVIVPDFTYPATASVVSIVGAVPVLVDINKDTMLIDLDKAEKAITGRTKVIIPVSLFGNPLNYDRLSKLKDKYGLIIIEDAACSIGSEFKGIKTGNRADISVFSLHPRKFITTGEGGMLTTENSIWAEWINSYKHFGMDMGNVSREGVQFNMIGSNYKLSNLQAAVGLAQMEIIDELLIRRIELAENYRYLLSGVQDCSLPLVTKKGVHSYQTFSVYIEDRDRIMSAMRNKGIEVQIGTYSLHLHKAFFESEQIRHSGNFKASEYAFRNCLALPLFHELSTEEQKYIVETLKNTIAQ